MIGQSYTEEMMRRYLLDSVVGGYPHELVCAEKARVKYTDLEDQRDTLLCFKQEDIVSPTLDYLLYCHPGQIYLTVENFLN